MLLKYFISLLLVCPSVFAATTRTQQADAIASPASPTKLLGFSFSGQTASTTLTLAPLSTTSQILNIPNITGTDTLSTLGLAQTFSGAQTFSTPPTFSSLTTAGVLLNSSAGLVSSSAGPLAVSNGGTGASTLTSGSVIVGNGTSAVNLVAPGASGHVLTSNGSTWVSSAAVAGNFGQETPSGNIDGSNTSFTLAHTPAQATSVIVFVNGNQLVQTTDYTQSGATLTFVTAPTLGQTIIVYYTY